MMDWNEIKPLLDAKLDPKHVLPPKQYGPKGAYIEGWHAISEANRIFGYGGWSYTIDLTREVLEEGKDRKGQAQWTCAYVCICRLTVGDTTRQDVGYGSGFALKPGDAIEGASKEAVTDALKRCLRTFGNPFGLALYDKKQEGVGAAETAPQERNAAPMDAVAIRDRIKKRIGLCMSMDDLGAVWKDERKTLSKLPPPMVAELTSDKNKLKASFASSAARQDGDPMYQ